MNFDYTYFSFFGTIIFEPVTILINFLIFIYAGGCFLKLRRTEHFYTKQWALFMLYAGFSNLFGAIAHGVHLQLGDAFFKVVFYMMNALSLFSIYYCFRAAFQLSNTDNRTPNKFIIYIVISWIIVLLFYTLFHNHFLIIKIHGGIVMLYSLVIHFLFYRKGEKGSGLIVLGIIFTSLTIIIHSLKFSLSEFFNYKDISHVIILISLFITYKGIKINSQKLDSAYFRR